MELESRGIPGVGIATTEFVKAAATQSEALGYETSIVFVPHPVQDRTDTELQQVADQVFDEVCNRLVS